MKVAEVYRSVQGEGRLTGTESVFVRASGCNLRCWFCDTPYASWAPEGVDRSVEELVAHVQRESCSHVVLTGGEPMLFAELIPLTHQIAELGSHITIETAGTLYLPVRCDLMSISPKLARSAPSRDQDAYWNDRHQRECHTPDVIRRLVAEYEYQVKFVIDTKADCQEVEVYLASLPEIDRARVMLMPQGTEQTSLLQRGEWLEPYCQTHGLQFCPRRHIEWYGLTRGT